MNISWIEVSLGFFTIAYLAGQAACQAATGYHGETLAIISTIVMSYGIIKGCYSVIQWNWGKGRERTTQTN